MAILFWLAFSFLVAALAKKWKRDAILWFFLALIFSPLLAGLVLTALHLMD